MTTTRTVIKCKHCLKRDLNVYIIEGQPCDLCKTSEKRVVDFSIKCKRCLKRDLPYTCIIEGMCDSCMTLDKRVV